MKDSFRDLLLIILCLLVAWMAFRPSADRLRDSTIRTLQDSITVISRQAQHLQQVIATQQMQRKRDSLATVRVLEHKDSLYREAAAALLFVQIKKQEVQQKAESFKRISADSLHKYILMHSKIK